MELRQDDFSVGPRNPDCNLGTKPPFLLHARPNAIAQTVSANALAINILLVDIASTPVSRRWCSLLIKTLITDTTWRPQTRKDVRALPIRLGLVGPFAQTYLGLE